MNDRVSPGKVELYMKEALSFLLRSMLMPALIREVLCRDKATIIAYHNPGPDTFRAHLNHLAKRYNIVSMDHLVSVVRGEVEWQSLPKKVLVITMDDGFSGNRDLISILDEFNIPVTIFMRPDGISRNNTKYLKREDVSELLKHNVTFGGHAMTHPYLTTLSCEEALGEINDSKGYLERELSIQIKHFAYPYGDYSKREISILKNETDYTSARTVKPGWIDRATNVYELKCMGVGDEVSINKMILDVTGVFPFLRIVRSKFFNCHFDKYRPPISYIKGLLGLRGPIAQHTNWQAEMIRKYAAGKKRVVEIGVSEGGSALAAISVMDPKGKMWLIDPYRSIFYPYFSLSLKIAKRAFAKYKDRDIVLLRDYSYNVAKEWNTKIDYLLMDGCHMEEAFARDWNDWSRFVHEDGVILVQSVQSPAGIETGASRVIRKLINKSDFEWMIVEKADATVVIKRRKK